MDEGDSPHSSSAKFKLIASVIANKNIFLDLHLYEHLKLDNALCLFLDHLSNFSFRHWNLILNRFYSSPAIGHLFIVIFLVMLVDLGLFCPWLFYFECSGLVHEIYSRSLFINIFCNLCLYWCNHMFKNSKLSIDSSTLLVMTWNTLDNEHFYTLNAFSYTIFHSLFGSCSFLYWFQTRMSSHVNNCLMCGKCVRHMFGNSQ